MATWKKSTKWQPASRGGGGQGVAVECEETGEAGLAKHRDLHREFLASKLARHLGLFVPEVRLDKLNNADVAISLSWGSDSIDVTRMRNEYPDWFNSEEMASARKRASGLLVFHVWVGNSDPKDDHVVVRPSETEYAFELASVDFQGAFAMPEDGGTLTVGGAAPVLMDLQFWEPSVAEAAIKAIEALTNEIIDEIVGSVPALILQDPEKKRIVKGLIARQEKLSAAFKAAGRLQDRAAGA
jgi:hypothetical protein